MLSTLIKSKAPSYNTKSYSKIKDLLLTNNGSAFISNQTENSFPDSEFEVCLDASYNENGLVTGISLRLTKLNNSTPISNQTTFLMHDDELFVSLNASFDSDGAVTDLDVID